MFIYACHMIDLVVGLLGKPDRVVPFMRQTRSDAGEMCDNGLVVFEYPKTTATIRTASLEVEGFRRRQFVVCGDEGTIEIRPLETYPRQFISAPQTPTYPVQDRDSYQKGYQEVSFQTSRRDTITTDRTGSNHPRRNREPLPHRTRVDRSGMPAESLWVSVGLRGLLYQHRTAKQSSNRQR